ncbi:uncharacterized protein K452DRAFT_202556, partial [Aplosporella prunicola CBS 121167]
FRDRQTSISFAPKVTLETGKHIPIDAPLPKMKGHDESSVVHHRTHSESDKMHYDPHTGEPLSQRRRPDLAWRAGISRHPLLQHTVDSLAHEAEVEESDRVASLTSATTASSGLDGSTTPIDYLQSPLAASSPSEFPFNGSAAGSRRASSVRSKNFFGSQNSSRRNTRRTSNRSRSNSSMSPASAFLSQWGKDEATSLIEPDDEGQEIPDHSGYFIGKQIGFGGFSVVKEVSTIDNGRKIIRAVKIVRKQVSGKDETENDKLQAEFEHEVEIWRYLKHPYILPLLAVYDTPFATFCITQLNTGGTLFDMVRTNRQAGKRLEPHLAKRYLYQLASALRYLHEDVHAVHRDVKLENCLIDMSGPDAATQGGNVLLCDFGMADFITNENRTTPSPPPEAADENIGPCDTSTCVAGSMEYAAPELLASKSHIYSTAVDMWAFGVVAYTLLTGNRPFSHSFQPALVMLIVKGEWDEQALREACADDEAVELVRNCLEKDSHLRWDVSDVLDSSYLEGCSAMYEDMERSWL